MALMPFLMLASVILVGYLLLGGKLKAERENTRRFEPSEVSHVERLALERQAIQGFYSLQLRLR